MRALRGELALLDNQTQQALLRGLDREDVALAGGDWGDRDDGEGCLLSLAAWELGLASGAELMTRSVAAVRVPVLFDELWLLLLERTGNAQQARLVTHTLVRQAIAVDSPVTVELHPLLPV